jgi:hypothetical protein
MRRIWRALAIVSAITLVVLGCSIVSSSADTPPGTDAWSTSVTLRTPSGDYEAPVHATLLPDGRVFFVGVSRTSWPVTASTLAHRAAWIFTPSAAGDPLPAETTPTQLSEPMELNSVVQNGVIINDDMFCAGATLTSDGKVFVAGGTRSWANSSGPIVVLGLPYDTEFDPTTTTINRVPGYHVVAGLTGTPGRWYPSATRLPDGRILILGGFDRVQGSGGASYNYSAETYDPATGQRAIAAPLKNLPKQVLNRDYTHIWTLPYPNLTNDLLMMGEWDTPVTTSSKAFTNYVISNNARPNSNGMFNAGFGQSSAMLEIRANNRDWGYTNGSVMVVGGLNGTPLISQADVYDPITNQWRSPIITGTERLHPSTITLPDGRILILNGHNMDGDNGVLRAQYIDPATGFSVTNGTSAMTDIRGYHSIALLLPDGRVLVGGGRDADTDTSLEKPTIQYYSPDYMTKPRPSIASAPTQIGYKQTFPIITSPGVTPKDAVLVGLGSMTHSFDSNQRVVQLPVPVVLPGANGTNVMIAGGPSDAWAAPPGYYMLFVLDQNRVPSVAKIVHVG